MEEEACLIASDPPSADDMRMRRLLEFFGVPYRAAKTAMFGQNGSSNGASAGKQRLLCSAASFSKLAEILALDPHMKDLVHSVFVYSNGDAAGLPDDLKGLTVSAANDCAAKWSIARSENVLGGGLRGLQVRPSPSALQGCNVFETAGTSAIPILFAGTKAAFLQTTWRGVPVFVTSTSLIDIDAELTTPNFDLRDHLFAAFPVVSYIKWAFPRASWSAPEASACLVIDDPLLKPRYGFIRFQQLLATMKEHNFSTSIAFIPWNWRRSDRATVQLFKDNPDRFSLCVHGCDHTAGEFGTPDPRRLHSLGSESRERMRGHESNTGLTHDEVMVFPQGVFSAEAIPQLQRSGFTAVVNTEVHSVPPREQKLTIADVWDVAVTSYGDLPIYTRRYPAQGVENLAFDVLLGKPCLVVIHHDFCRGGCVQLADFMDRLNALEMPLRWRSLGEVVRRGFRQKEQHSGRVEIEMYGNELRIENRSAAAKSYTIRKRQSDGLSIQAIEAGDQKLPWSSREGGIEFKTELSAGESALIRVRFGSAQNAAKNRPNFRYAAKTMARRYLSEARDNYLAPAKASLARR